MTSARKQSARVQRLHSLDTSRLSSLSAELSALVARINHLQAKKHQLKQQIDQHALGQTSVAALRQTITWQDRIVEQIAEFDDSIRQIDESRTQLLEAIQHQRSKIQGWEIYIQKLEQQIAADLESQASSEADDRYLQQHSVKTTSRRASHRVDDLAKNANVANN